MDRAQPDVIVVGGGPVGLGAALELARFGVRSVLLEKHDLVGSTFTLLAAAGGASWAPVAAKAATALDVALGCYVVGAAGLQDDGSFARAYGLEAGGAVLVRPDGHIAWRHSTGPADGDALCAALRTVLGR